MPIILNTGLHFGDSSGGGGDYGNFVTPKYYPFIKLRSIPDTYFQYNTQGMRSFVYNRKLYILNTADNRNLSIYNIDTGSLIKSIRDPLNTFFGQQLSILRYGARAYVYAENTTRGEARSQQVYFGYIDLNNDIVVHLSPAPQNDVQYSWNGDGTWSKPATINLFIDTTYNKIFLCGSFYTQSRGTGSNNNIYHYENYNVCCYDIASNSWKVLYKWSRGAGSNSNTTYLYRPSQDCLIDSNSSTIIIHSNWGTNSGAMEFIINRGSNPALSDTSSVIPTILTQNFASLDDKNSYTNIIGMCDNRMAVHGNKLFRYNLFNNSTSGENILGACPSAYADYPASYSSGVSFSDNTFWYYTDKTLYYCFYLV